MPITLLLRFCSQLTVILFATITFNQAFSKPIHKLPPVIQQVLEKSAIPASDISIWVASVATGSPIIEFQDHTPRRPASVTKLFTTAVGLLLLGKDYRWKTDFYTNGYIKNGNLMGDLIIKGYGNPYMVEEKMMVIVNKLQNLGIRNIKGDIILDNSYFLANHENPDSFDNRGIEPYNALPDALAINFRTINLFIQAKKDKIIVYTEPKLSQTHIDNQLVLSLYKKCQGKGFSPKISVNRQKETINLSGEISPSCGTKKFTKVLTHAGDLFFSHFRRSWIENGGELKPQWYYGKAGKQDKLLIRFLSRPLYEQIAAMNKLSNNLMARQLFLTLGAEMTKPPATVSKSRAVMLNALWQLGVSTRNLFIENGSGLSRQTRITVNQVGQLLLAMQKNKSVFSYFENSLAIAGIDGTLRGRLRNTPLVGNAIGKTGTLDNTKSIAGYLTAQNGKKYAYAIFINGEKAEQGRNLMDKIMQWIYYSN